MPVNRIMVDRDGRDESDENAPKLRCWKPRMLSHQLFDRFVDAPNPSDEYRQHESTNGEGEVVPNRRCELQVVPAPGARREVRQEINRTTGKRARDRKQKGRTRDDADCLFARPLKLVDTMRNGKLEKRNRGGERREREE